MRTPPVLAPVQHWVCPNCETTLLTQDARAHTPFHSCPGLRGLTAPLVSEGITCKVEAVERADYIGNEDVQRDGEGRPVMSVVTTRDDGQDCAVLAPTASVTQEA